MDSTEGDRQRRRRTDSKSRDGCYACKTRKLKCCETKPLYTSCLKRQVYCRYPTRSQTVPSTDVAAPRPLLPTFPTTEMSQGQYFNHCLSVTYPFMPAGNEDLWKTYIPQYASHNEHLMAAILGLSAGHCHSMHALYRHFVAASTYRAQALAGLKSILSKNIWDRDEVDAAIAISYLFGFQSRLMVSSPISGTSALWDRS